MDNCAFSSAYDVLYSSLTRHGYSKEATELQEIVLSAAAPPTAAPPTAAPPVRGRFEEERPPENKQQSIYKGQPGSAAPVIELSRIIDRVEKSPSFKKLPSNVMRGILKIKKMTSDAFKYASEKEALFGRGKDPVKNLHNLLINFEKSNPTPREMPDEVKRALNNLNALVTQALPQEKSILEKGKDVARGVAEKGKGLLNKGQDIARGVAEKGQQIKQDFQQKREDTQDEKREKSINKFEEEQVTDERQQSALNALKKSLFNFKVYKDIFYRLPPKITKELKGIGLGLDDLGGMATAKAASHVNRTLLNYLRTKEAYSKSELNMGKKEEKEHNDLYDMFAKIFKNKKLPVPMSKEQFAVSVAKAHLKEDPKYYSKLKKTFSKKAMDFTGIGNLITPEGTLDERELARVIRLAIAAELDATHLYELIVDTSDDDTVKKVLQDISNEEKVHVGELQELLKKFDDEDEKFLEEGKKEVQELNK